MAQVAVGRSLLRCRMFARRSARHVVALRSIGTRLPLLPPPLLSRRAHNVSTSSSPSEEAAHHIPSARYDANEEVARKGVSQLLAAYRRYGHYEAGLDPLGLRKRRPRSELEASKYFPPGYMEVPLAGLTPPPLLGLSGNITPVQVVQRLRQVYCGPVGFEFDHIDRPEEREWWSNRIEELFGRPVQESLTLSERKNAAALMLQAQVFESFVAKKYPGFKRYSGEGAEAMQPAIEAVLREACASGVQDVVMCIAHRGRLALLASQLHYPVARLFHKVAGRSEFPLRLEGVVDDVTSHIAASLDKEFPGTGAGEEGNKGKVLHVTLVHNPSHLEVVGCVAAGKTRAKIHGGSSAMCLQIHGDAAFAGQGVIPETLSISELQGFQIGGTFHLVVNNQVGFTTEADESRASSYCTDVGKISGIPVIHVNGEEVDHVLLASKLAMEYRQRFHRDVILDLVCYRKHGHNEVDEPSFTQPLMYREIRRRDRPTPAEAYVDRLRQEGVITADRAQRVKQQSEEHMERQYQEAQSYDIEQHPPDYLQGKWDELRHAVGHDVHAKICTGVPEDVLVHIALSSLTMPESFHIHDRLQRAFVGARSKLLEEGLTDWAMAEALAFGSLMAQGFDIRLCGQDSQRGTFSQRHMVVVDQLTGERFCPLSNVVGTTGKLEVVNSTLSELAIMGFEFGYSLENPRHLVIWEAQFGDFSNVAQVIIDQFVSGSEAKWLRQSGLVLLLPHGYDGGGPEHSSGRLERFLQLCDSPGITSVDIAMPEEPNTNMIVVNLTTPANYFHALRRQLLRPFRKPLVVMAPKTLLRHASATSKLEEMYTTTTFQPVIATTLDGKPLVEGPTLNNHGIVGDTAKLEQIQSVVLCSGKVYYDAIKAEGAAKKDPGSVAMIRLEELAPFPTKTLTALLNSMPNASSFIWLQEEPANGGAWTYVAPHVARCLHKAGKSTGMLRYVGRPPLPTPAVGLPVAHKQQDQAIMTELWSKA